MNERVPITLGYNISLLVLISCDKLRIRMRPIKFVLDTGSPESYLSQIDIQKLQIPLSSRETTDKINLGGSQYNTISLPKFKFYMLKDDKSIIEKDDITLYALQPLTTSPTKLQFSQTLPSILGLDFLREQKLSLHVILTEDMTYLQYEN